jgi:hypothetical protein
MQGHDEGTEGAYLPREAEVAVPAMPENFNAEAKIRRRGAQQPMSFCASYFPSRATDKSVFWRGRPTDIETGLRTEADAPGMDVDALIAPAVRAHLWETTAPSPTIRVLSRDRSAEMAWAAEGAGLEITCRTVTAYSFIGRRLAGPGPPGNPIANGDCSSGAIGLRCCENEGSDTGVHLSDPSVTARIELFSPATN